MAEIAGLDRYTDTANNMPLLDQSMEEENPFDAQLEADNLASGAPMDAQDLAAMPEAPSYYAPKKTQPDQGVQIAQRPDVDRAMQPVQEKVMQLEAQTMQNLAASDELRGAAAQIEEQALQDQATKGQELLEQKALRDTEIEAKAVEQLQSNQAELLNAKGEKTETPDFRFAGFLKGFVAGLQGRESNFGQWVQEFKQKSAQNMIAKISKQAELGNTRAKAILSDRDRLQRASQIQLQNDMGQLALEAKAAAKKARTPEEKAKYIDTVAKIQADRGKQQIGLLEKAASQKIEQENRQFEQGGTPGAPIIDLKDLRSKADLERAIPLKDGKAILAPGASPKDMGEIKVMSAKRKDFLDTVKRYQKFTQEFGSFSDLNPTRRAVARTLGANMISAAQTVMNSGVLNKEEIPFFAGIVPSDPRIFNSIALRQLAEFKKTLDDTVINRIESMTGRKINLKDL